VTPLQAAGHHVQALDLPGRGADADRAATVTLDDWVARVSGAVDAAPEPPILVAHSMGGVSSSQLAERRPGDVRELVYLSAVVPVDGAAALPTLQEAGEECVLLREGAIVFAADGSTATIPPHAAREAFYGRCAEPDVEAALAQLCPEPVLPLMTPLTLGPAFASVRKSYLGATDDRAVPPAFQRRLAEQCGGAYATIEADHSPFLSAPGVLVEALLAHA
jgi:pimeloyl-ACP methyl ester carboxylesterase